MTTQEIINELEIIQSLLNTKRYKDPDNFISKKEVKDKIKALIEKAKISVVKRRGIKDEK